MSRPRCVITGCALVSPQEEFCVWGDLHEVGSTWVFNGVVNQRDGETGNLIGEAHRQYRSPPPDAIKQLVIHDSTVVPYFERRGVFVIAKSLASLNQAAKEYLA